MRGAAKLVPRGSNLLHERHVRRGQPLVLREQRMRLVDLRAKPLLQRCHHMRLGWQGATGAAVAVAVAHEMAEMRWRRLLEAVGVAGRQAGRVAEVVEVVVVRGKARRVAEVVEEVVGREVGVKRGRRMVAAAAGAGVGRRQRVAVAAGHGESPEPY